MLIEQYIKHVERYFWDRKQIQKVVDEEKEQRTARKGHTGGGGHAFITCNGWRKIWLWCRKIIWYL